jgi:voltage-gated potassium channel
MADFSSSNWKHRLNQLLFHPENPSGKAVELVLLFSILASIIEILLDSVPSLHRVYRGLFEAGELVFTLFFTLEYVLRLMAADRPLAYARSFFGVIDLIALLPSYLGLLAIGIPSLMILRALRFLRIFRILKLLRYSEEARELILSLKASMSRIFVFLFFVLILALVVGSLMYFLEAPDSGFTSIPQAIYWTIVTLTTVGYGDIAPQTVLGKLLASVIMLLGYGIIAVPTGLITLGIRQAYLNDGKTDGITNDGINSAIALPANAQNLQSCPRCKTQNHDEDANYCKYCGANLSVSDFSRDLFN